MAHRRHHKKSRFGCRECKRRRIKVFSKSPLLHWIVINVLQCDESRPICTNCKTNLQECVYEAPAKRAVRTNDRPSSHSPAAALSYGTSNSFASPSGLVFTPESSTSSIWQNSTFSVAPTPPSIGPSVAFDPTLNMRHMELVNHFILHTAPSMAGRHFVGATYFSIMWNAALANTYLMYEVLALSALHISCTRIGSEQVYYRDEAAALQNRALALFSSATAEITAENCSATLMFASLLGLHALADTVSSHETNSDGFLDKFVTYLNLHRGVRAITNQSWNMLKESDLSPMLHAAEDSLRSVPSSDSSHVSQAIDELYGLLDRNSGDSEAKTACRDAVDHLQRVLLAELVPQDQQASAIGLIWAWPVLLSGVFTDLLMQRRPEALIILCHYAVLLHHQRQLWFVGDTGRSLITGITSFLGTYWKQWLAWPNQMLEQSP